MATLALPVKVTELKCLASPVSSGSPAMAVMIKVSGGLEDKISDQKSDFTDSAGAKMKLPCRAPCQSGQLFRSVLCS